MCSIRVGRDERKRKHIENGQGQKEDEKTKKTDERNKFHPGIMIQIGAEEKGARMVEKPAIHYNLKDSSIYN
eukprot:13383694-Heterocapsa_arctica.AAC.1